ncbi:GNAT family acetyltransferase [Pontibacillus chungwhensis BH030062]|uniref:GNAT family acetyltransferase n=1 Tax=Pontibacillus chungwhensis BH030062 TaxID=1385513 RepID=A0A0A2V0B0_9BACI|nr:GNAT family N-acetyltransferase [Pontibacillus chungwhensis]KGP92448.1 GNAT family acetyltransferase [Pontibacillus chungwhensis BH030062]
MSITQANPQDAEAILNLQRKAYIQEAERYNDYSIQPLTQTLDQVKADFDHAYILKYVHNDQVIGSARAKKDGGTCHIGKVMVHPDYQKRGIGRELMYAIERQFPGYTFELFTGSKSYENIAFYEKLGYLGYKKEKLPREETVFLFMRK